MSKRPTVADRHNNPLNIKYGDATKHWVQSGVATIGEAAKDGGNFLKFSSSLAGLKAAEDLLGSSVYSNLPVDSAMKKWSNKGYGEEVAPELGKGRLLSDLSPQERRHLVSSMAKREGSTQDLTGTTSPRSTTPSFNDLAKNFDPEMPMEDYDKVRENYYYSVVAPKLSSAAAVRQGWEDFKKGTERPSTLGLIDRMITKTAVGATEFAKELIAPVKGAVDLARKFGSRNVELEGETDPMKMGPVSFLDHKLTTQQKQLEAVAKREGIDTSGMKMVGGLVGQVPGIAASYLATGPIASALILPKFAQATAGIKFANRVVHGGLAFGTLQAVRETSGNRLVAGLKGFAEGAAFDGALGLLSLPKYLRTASPLQITDDVAATVARDAAQGKPVPEVIDKKIADYIKNQNELARVEARPSFVNQTDGERGVWITVTNREGQPLRIGVKPGEERALVNQINAMIDKGGSLSGIDYHSSDAKILTDFLGLVKEKSAEKYEYAKRIVVPNEAEAVAAQAQKEGIAAHATSPHDIQVEGVKAPAPLPEGVTFKGKQMTADPNVFLDMYEVKLPGGEATTFIVRPGQDVGEKALITLKKFESTQLPKVSRERAELLVRQMGGDPATADIEAIMQMGPEEITRILEESAKAKGVQPGAAAPRSLLEEKVRLGGPKAQLVTKLPVPKSELPGATVAEGVRPNPRLKFHKFAATVEVPEGALKNTLNYNATGAEWDDWRKILQSVGQKVPPGYEHLNMPGIIYESTAKPGERYHEMVHAGLDHLGFNFEKALKPLTNKYFSTGDEAYTAALELIPIGHNLMKEMGDLYGKMPLDRLLNEAFTYSAQAVRSGDTELLAQLGAWNGGVKGVLGSVNEMSKILLAEIPKKIDSIPIRIVQRGLEDLVRRTDKHVTASLRRAASGLTHKEPYWDGTAGKWALRESDTGVSYYTNINQLWDDIAKREEVLDQLPSFSFYSELMGVRGPIKPGGPAKKTPPMPNEPIEGGWKRLGWTTLRGYFEPTLPFAAAADTKMNALLRARGEHIPIYNTVKDLIEGVERSTNFNSATRKRFGDLLVGTKHERQHDFFEVLTRMGITTESKVVPGEVVSGVKAGEAATRAVEPRVTVTRRAGEISQDLIDRYKLEPKEIEKIKGIQQELLDLQEASGIPIMEYLSVGSTTGQAGIRGGLFQRLRNANWNPGSVWGTTVKGSEGFWEDAVRNGRGHFDPQDTHLGKFLSWIVDQAGERKFLSDPLRRLDSIVNKKSPDGKYVLGPLRYPFFNLSRYVRGIPDTSQQAINSVVSTFTNTLSKKFKEMNTHLPDFAKLPEEFSSPQALMAKWMLFSYAAGAGSRPALILRDAMQAFLTALPVMGPARFFSGMAKTLTREGWERAERAGAHLGKNNMGELYGDVFSELPVAGDRSALVRLANLAVQPLRWGNDLARTLVYNGEYDTALGLVQSIRDGKAGVVDLLKGTSLKFHDEPNISRLLAQAVDTKLPAEQVARRLALDTVHLTQWPYLRGTQPALLRTGAGRLFGQYGSWPLNYISFLGRMSAKMAHPELRADATQAAAMWVAINYSVGSLLEDNFGIDSSNWVWGSPAVYTGGPAFSLAQDMMMAVGDTPEARQARRNILSSGRHFVPAYTELKSIITAINESGDPGYKDFLKVLGFRPLEKIEEDRDIQEWLSYQAGLPQQ